MWRHLKPSNVIAHEFYTVDLPDCIKVKQTPTHLHVHLDIWMVTIHLEEDDEDWQYFFDSKEKAEFAGQWAAHSRYTKIIARTDTLEVTMEPDGDGDFTKHEISYWLKKPAHQMKDRVIVRHTPQDWCVL